MDSCLRRNDTQSGLVLTYNPNMVEIIPVRLLIVDDHQLFRKALETPLKTDPRINLVGTAADGEMALMLSRRLTPEVILADLHMPILDGFGLLERLRQLPGAPPYVLAITGDSDPMSVQRALAAGARGYLLKDNVTEENVVSAACAVADGGLYLDPQVMDGLLSQQIEPDLRSLADGLNDDDRRLLCCVAHGYENKEIAARMDISIKTVSNRLSLLYTKISVKNRVHAANFAYRCGLVNLDDVSFDGGCDFYETCP